MNLSNRGRPTARLLVYSKRTEGGQDDALNAEDLFEFIDQGGSSGPARHHLMVCQECLFELEFLLLCEAPATLEEEAVLRSLPKWTAEELLERLRPKIASSRTE